VSTRQGSTTTPLASNIAYAGIGGAFGEMTSANLSGTTYLYSASYDLLGRATDTNVKRTSDSGVIFDQSRTFDAVGNVTTESMTLPAGTDIQVFCYDEQDRVVGAGLSCSYNGLGLATFGGTLTAGHYTQSFTYDAMGRLTSGPQGTYAYGDPAHVHGATGAGVTYTSSYDAAGDMTCRAPTTASTCTGTSPTGAKLSYNNEAQLASWQNTPTSPTTTAGFLYDGAGQRVAQQVVQGGSTTTTVYVGGVEEVASSGGTTTTTTYYEANGTRIALGVNGAFSYLASDALGSATVVFGSNGTATASVLYAPYGGVRYSAGTMPTSYGFTGQRVDAASGLNHYGARYYDPMLGQFTSADTVLVAGILGLSRYAYVEGNPILRTDPTGHMEDPGGFNPCDVPGACGGGGGGGGGCDILPDCAGGGGGGSGPPPDPCANGGCNPGPPDRCGSCNDPGGSPHGDPVGKKPPDAIQTTRQVIAFLIHAETQVDPIADFFWNHPDKDPLQLWVIAHMLAQGGQGDSNDPEQAALIAMMATGQIGLKGKPITTDEAVAQAVEHVGPTGIIELTGNQLNFQFRAMATDVNGNVIARIGRLDLNVADKHVALLGPHLNLEIHVNGRIVANIHVPIDPSTIRSGDTP
jgi:RHS repeat-associated protein